MAERWRCGNYRGKGLTQGEFIDELLRYEYSSRTKKTLLEDISIKTGIKIDNVEKLAHHLLDEHSYEEILGLLYTSVPQGVPSISYKSDEFRKLEGVQWHGWIVKVSTGKLAQFANWSNSHR